MRFLPVVACCNALTGLKSLGLEFDLRQVNEKNRNQGPCGSEAGYNTAAAGLANMQDALIRCRAHVQAWKNVLLGQINRNFMLQKGESQMLHRIALSVLRLMLRSFGCRVRD